MHHFQSYWKISSGCSSTYDEKLADPETTTPKNCTCASECKGILPLYERDVCYTGKY